MPPASPEFRCRAARDDDEAFLWEALYHAIHVPAGRGAPPLEIVCRPELARYVQGWSAAREPGFVAETADGKRIGAAWARLLQGDHAGYGHVADEVPELTVAVLPGRRGIGVGTSLLRRLLDALPARFARVSLSVSRSNPARRLYARLGFCQVKMLDDDTIVMVREFGAEPVWGTPLAVYWKNGVVGHFESWPDDNDFPRINGRWTKADSPLARQFEAILLSDHYLIASPALRVRLANSAWGDCLVTALWADERIAGEGADVTCYRIVLSPLAPPGVGVG